MDLDLDLGRSGLKRRFQSRNDTGTPPASLFGLYELDNKDDQPNKVKAIFFFRLN
jgi:hypothetical protein